MRRSEPRRARADIGRDCRRFANDSRDGEGTPQKAYTQALFVANRAYKVTAIRQVHSTAGTDGGSVTVSVSKDTGTQAPGAGVGLLTAAFNLKAAVNTVQTGSLSATEADLKLAAGDRLAVVFGGTLTAVAGVVVTIELQVL